MNKIRVIDLLNKIANGEQPKHIKFKGEDWWWGYDTYTYYEDLKHTPDAQISLFTRYRIDYCLNDKVEIIEENKKIDTLNWKSCATSIKELNENIGDLINKINEIIDKINKMEDK